MAFVPPQHVTAAIIKSTISLEMLSLSPSHSKRKWVMIVRHRPRHSSTCSLKDMCRALNLCCVETDNERSATEYNGLILRLQTALYAIKSSFWNVGLSQEYQDLCKSVVAIPSDLPWCCFEKVECSRTERLHNISLDWKDARKGQALLRCVCFQNDTQRTRWLAFLRQTATGLEAVSKMLDIIHERDDTKGKCVSLLLKTCCWKNEQAWPVRTFFFAVLSWLMLLSVS